jgi:predicted methyltransferase
MKIGAAFLALILMAGCKTAPKAPEVKPLPASVEEAVASPYRSAANMARDQYRHPVETLNFFGIKPNMTVIEITPGGGWYMEILAPLLTAQGKYIWATPPASTGDYAKKGIDAGNAWLASHPELKAQMIDFNPPADLAVEAPVDMILTFRNVHNWTSAGTDQAAFKAFFKALKPGGILGVTDHRANPKGKRDSKAKSGYVREAEVIKMATRAGFKLAAKSEINANPKDTKNYSDGVWTLPPTLRLGDKDRDKYLAIGESDRMTLKFVKP